MKKLLLISIISIFLVGCSASEDLSISCEENNGRWLLEHNECEYISMQWCKENKGQFKGCTSACRHQPDAMICTKQCVPVCLFK